MAVLSEAKLKDSDCFHRVCVTSAKPQAERLLDFNFTILLREIPARKDFCLAGSGLLVKRTSAGTGWFEEVMPSL